MTTGAAVVTTAGIAETAADSGPGRTGNPFFESRGRKGDFPLPAAPCSPRKLLPKRYFLFERAAEDSRRVATRTPCRSGRTSAP